MTLPEAWLKEEQRAMVGWDFGALHGRVLEEPLPWDYRAFVMHQLSPEARLLDMGTGGGEFLLTLGHPQELTAIACATCDTIDTFHAPAGNARYAGHPEEGRLS